MDLYIGASISSERKMRLLDRLNEAEFPFTVQSSVDRFIREQGPIQRLTSAQTVFVYAYISYAQLGLTFFPDSIGSSLGLKKEDLSLPMKRLSSGDLGTMIRVTLSSAESSIEHIFSEMVGRSPTLTEKEQIELMISQIFEKNQLLRNEKPVRIAAFAVKSWWIKTYGNKRIDTRHFLTRDTEFKIRRKLGWSSVKQQ